MFAAVPSIVSDLGVLFGVCAAAIALSLTPPAKWLARQLIGEPVTRWARRVSAEANAPVSDEVASLRTDFNTHAEYTRHHLGPNGTTPPIYTRLIAVEQAVAPRAEDAPTG